MVRTAVIFAKQEIIAQTYWSFALQRVLKMSNSVYEGNVLGGYDDIDQSVVQSDTYSETEAPIDGEAVLTGLANITSAAGTRLVIGIDYGTTYTGIWKSSKVDLVKLC